ncbi:flippase [Pedobacter sp. BMA]|uniref:flippase n=1 Tax=Pedobacter sp. BMA TaxID=1663685 RepID=UPI00064B686B|nr:flippase [Pedobacter sp. BMA]KLT64074.1 polysaccharide biosynthesis protein [Pedobacter sp. BMA]
MKLPGIKGFDEEALKKYFKNTGMLLIGKVGSLAIKMLSSIAVANYLLSYGNGILTTSVSYVFLFAALAGLGLDQFIVKELHQYPEKREQILGTAFSLKSFAGLICIPLIYVAWLIYPLEGIKYSHIFLLSFMGIFQSFTIIDSYFQSEVKSKYIMQVQIIGNLVSAAIKVGLILMHSSITFFFIAYLFDTILLSAGYIITYNRKGRSIFNWKYDFSLAKKLLTLSWPLIISGIMVSIYMRVDQIMLKQILGDKGIKEAGAYNTVVMFSEALNFVPIAIVSSLFPAILNARRDDKVRYQKRLQNLYDLMVWLSLSFAIFITIASPIIYKLYKPEYISAAPVLSVHVWGSTFVFLGVASGQYLIAENFGHLSFIRTGLGAIINIVLNILLIPTMGMMGTAIATVSAYFASAFFILFIPKLRQQGIMMLKSLFLVTAFQKIFKR